MRQILLVGVSAIALALGGCGMFNRGESTQSNTGYTPSASSQAQAAPSTAPRSQAQTAAQSSTGAGVEQSGTSSTGRMATSRNAGGADRQEIMQAQQKLQSDGLYKGKVDGIDGPRTRQAVMAFQKQNGLKQTGQLDQQTMAQLTSSSGSSSATGSTSPSGSQSPTAGSTGTSGPTSTTGNSSSAPSNSSTSGTTK